MRAGEREERPFCIHLPINIPAGGKHRAGCAERAEARGKACGEAARQDGGSAPAQGRKQAQIIRAEADAEAARVYAQSFGKDQDFYAFYRAMQAYRTTFNNGNASVVLSPDNEFLREFQGVRGR